MSPTTNQTTSLIPLGVNVSDDANASIAALFAKLQEPFKESELEFKIPDEESDVFRGEDGQYYANVFAYLDARCVQERLDQVFGLYWGTKLTPVSFDSNTARSSGSHGMICEVSVYLPGVGWLTKSDAGDSSTLEPVRGAASVALKRAGTLFGIGRYLYSIGKLTVPILENGTHMIRVAGKKMFWSNPLLAPEFLPHAERPARVKLFAQMAEESAAKAKLAQEVAAAKAKADQEAAAARAKANAEAVAARASTTSAESSNSAGALSAATIKQLDEILGPDKQLALDYLKFKRKADLGINAISQLRPDQAEAVIKLGAEATQRLSLLKPVADLVAGRSEAANAYFIARGLIKVNEHWFALKKADLAAVAAEASAFSLALDTFGANANSLASAA